MSSKHHQRQPTSFRVYLSMASENSEQLKVVRRYGRRQRTKIGEIAREEHEESRRGWSRVHVKYVYLSLSPFPSFSVRTFVYIFFRIGNPMRPLTNWLRSIQNRIRIILLLLLLLRWHRNVETNEAAKSIQCKVCMQSFVSTLSHSELRKHAENKHPKLPAVQCFPFLTAP